MENKDLKTTVLEINKFCKNKIYSLNSGGCGWFAYYMSLELIKRNVAHRICFINNKDRKNDRSEVRKLTRKNDLGHVYVNHAFISCNGMFFDGYNFFNTMKEMIKDWGFRNNQESIFDHNMTTSGLHMMLTDQGWNRQYDKDQNPKLRKGIQKSFKLVEENIL
jgi:hypothetical protein